MLAERPTRRVSKESRQLTADSRQQEPRDHRFNFKNLQFISDWRTRRSMLRPYTGQNQSGIFQRGAVFARSLTLLSARGIVTRLRRAHQTRGREPFPFCRRAFAHCSIAIFNYLLLASLLRS